MWSSALLSVVVFLGVPAAHAAECSDANPCDVGGACSEDTDCLTGLACEYSGTTANARWTLTCQMPAGHGDYCAPGAPCDLGLGDCDADADCVSGLQCESNTGSQYGWASWVDTCELPPNGAWDRCSPGFPCAQGEGDCDTDADCASGLRCADNMGAEYGLDPQVDTCEPDHVQCSPGAPCGDREGDCDTDDDCASGLSCRHDVGDIYGYETAVDVCVPSSLSCPEDYFSSYDRATAVDVVFRLPIDTSTANHIAPLGPGATNWFFDHDDDQDEIVTFEAGHLSYDGHVGTDFMLSFGWMALVNGSMSAVAAADGVVMDVDDGNPDLCGVGVISYWPWRVGVVCNGDDPHDLSANEVEVCHADGTVTEYLHLMNGEMDVEVDDEVACGDPLGLVASSGNSAAPHLHFQVAQDGELVDPFHTQTSSSLWVDQGNAFTGLPAESCQ